MLLNCSIGEDSWEPLGLKGYQTSHPKGNQPWIFNGSINAEAEAPILWSPNTKNCIIGKDPDTGKDWRQEKETTEDEMVGWYHRLDEREFEQTLGVGDGQRSLAYCSPWDPKELDMIEQLNRTPSLILYLCMHVLASLTLEFVKCIFVGFFWLGILKASGK